MGGSRAIGAGLRPAVEPAAVGVASNLKDSLMIHFLAYVYELSWSKTI